MGHWNKEWRFKSGKNTEGRCVEKERSNRKAKGSEVGNGRTPNVANRVETKEDASPIHRDPEMQVNTMTGLGVERTPNPGHQLLLSFDFLVFSPLISGCQKIILQLGDSEQTSLNY